MAEAGAEASGSIRKHPRCAGIRRDGQRCTAPGLVDGWCYAHAPGLAEHRAAARRKGGHGRRASARLGKLMPARLMPVFSRLKEALARVDTGELEPKRAQAMAALARAMTTVLQVGELEQRIAALEQRTRENGYVP